MRFGELQHKFPVDLQGFRLQLSTIFGHLATQNPANIDQGTAAADHADIVRTVAHNVAFCTQHSRLQCYRIQSSDNREVTQIRMLHHRPPGKR